MAVNHEMFRRVAARLRGRRPGNVEANAQIIAWKVVRGLEPREAVQAHRVVQGTTIEVAPVPSVVDRIAHFVLEVAEVYTDELRRLSKLSHEAEATDNEPYFREKFDRLLDHITARVTLRL